jgi:hypothetical protein
MKTARAKLNRALALLGVPGIAGLGLALAALGVYASVVAPGASRIAAMQETAARFGTLAQGPEQAQGTRGPLSDFYDFFPPSAALTDALNKVYALAEAEGLDIPKGEYRFARAPEAPIATFQAVFPVRGSYLQVRRFAAAVLNELPFVSLDDLRFEKQRAADLAIDSQIRLTFFLRAQ